MFSELFDVYSRRNEYTENPKPKSLSPEFRNRVVMLFKDWFQFTFNTFLQELQRKVAYLYGKYQLTTSPRISSSSEDMLQFILTCKDEHFLDVIETIFHSNLQGITYPDNALIPSINGFFRIDNLPYYLTGYSIENYQTTFSGSTTTGMRIAEYPKIIRKDCEILHQTAIVPTLTLLNRQEYIYANNEFQKALEDFRKGDFGDCLTKCGSAFESVMKVLCDKNSIPYNKTDTASILLKALLANGKLEGYWEQPLILIATLRNRLSSSHGAGTEVKDVSEHVATYVINATASAILFLSSEYS